MNDEQVKVTEYADTAYKGKADPYYRENIAGPDERKRHLAKGQCQLGIYLPDHQIFMIGTIKVKGLMLQPKSKKVACATF